ncbi:hypothetical protein AOQ84DRAFT_306556 [Glonium stellatum]|uniref:Uncharacterized protein n=1 Tax=Glonium stellatum TaxID=574774 RepID=A0A8E2JLV0_9PEZI|nr:hypothetical protein AOQ84DRAFT_306556 [Glonium stellatum]
MFDFSRHETLSSKCYFTHSVLPNYAERDQPPTKKKPFSTFLSQPFAHTLDLILPDEIHELIQQQLDGDVGTVCYARVYMSLGEILMGDFFNEYIKKGNILMLSEGRPGVDNMFSLYEGVLKLELDRPTYERCGLVGKPIPDGGRKHAKSRYAIEYNLRLPSMLHGKRGFERLVWACKNVLNNSLAWLFHDPQAPSSESESPIAKHCPILKSIRPTITNLPNTLVPTITAISDTYNADASADLLEWLGLVSLDSPRIRAHDSIDPYLSRYQVPELGESDPVARNLVRMRWYGFIPPNFIRDVYIRARKVVGEEWFAMNVSCFHGQAYSLLNHGAKDTLSWEYN